MSVEQLTRPVPSPVSSRVSGADADRSTGSRVLAVWCPDWPVVAAMAEENLPRHAAVAVLDKGEVFACSATARDEGVRRGMRRRDAASRCPDLLLIDRNPDTDARAFEAVLAAVEEVSPGVEPLRPGLCALRVPSRFYGGEAEAAAVIAERLVAEEIWDCRFGVADSLFAAEQAARAAEPQDCVVVAPGGSAGYLAGLAVAVLGEAAPDPREGQQLVSLLKRMGIRTLGDYAGLPVGDIATRFGRFGVWAHRAATGQEGRTAVGRRPPPELVQQIDFAPGLETIEPIAFSSRQTAERFVGDLARLGRVCSAVRIEVATESGWHGHRVWSHPRWFTAVDLIDRLRWQLQAEPAPDPVAVIRFLPEVVESLGAVGDGLWGSAPDEQIERGMARVQSIVGFDGVLSPREQGGRQPAERQQLTPWGEDQPRVRPGTLPWPGSLPDPAPTRVYLTPQQAQVLTGNGLPVTLTERGAVSGVPTSFRPTPETELITVEAWAGPWPIDELWWDAQRARKIARFQLVGVDGSAWLLVVERGQWWTEARYD
ncbi:protein ImuB [Friedmanniella endophytica]|uniref:Protein ImuB n=1 Tax=Microlunatus kandeliicorticis TaxID=1759536 RepID=A0A7W3ITV9_9ACTN|nr:DNA polymerase Y family protein [Microlunatus kandeliicorticis]MBA8795125.1 protein ImuB [Microlunatus kandeliicorticis]